jgi:glutamine synthetase
MSELKKKTDAMRDARKKANLLKDVTKKAFSYSDIVKPFFEDIRYHSDKLEQLLDDKAWPLAKYRELLFIK